MVQATYFSIGHLCSTGPKIEGHPEKSPDTKYFLEKNIRYRNLLTLSNVVNIKFFLVFYNIFQAIKQDLLESKAIQLLVLSFFYKVTLVQYIRISSHLFLPSLNIVDIGHSVMINLRYPLMNVRQNGAHKGQKISRKNVFCFKSHPIEQLQLPCWIQPLEHIRFIALFYYFQPNLLCYKNFLMQ